MSCETVASAPAAARLHDSAHRDVTAVDPRTKIVVLVLINFLVLGSGPFVITLTAAGIVAMLYLSVANWRGAMKFTVFVGVCSAAFLVLPGIVGGPIGAVFAVTGYWLARFGVSCGYAAYFISTTGPAQISAALVALRFPKVVVVPLVVVMRFIPTVAQELHAISEAMVLRGIYPGPIGALMHPIRSAEFIIVPLLAASSRIADDLSASAMLRGLGTHRHPTSIERLRFHFGDALILACIVALTAFSLFGKGLAL
ncbi:energy-coupling factor transporter transmembrane component T [Bifidobacterium crudilactis]|uniref:energy-coupling factor transporter transmembrane component T n=1 Tax=Bifidobacterium crudilactis TaxID=327277 RepID=UPI00138DEAAB|nr:energy-coupling factor transporter transmembrane component T [Bifidobacterium crudilactis]MCI2148637.1 energy-coupling factor transporter transmembrane protein EcfT [Bifidobacterium crudilactis]MCI2157486.1 energy-coupling factor transporter transmembrane protein EcfT [Bifidobacterium crudilactis]